MRVEESLTFSSKDLAQTQSLSVADHLRLIITQYLEKRPQLSVNGISKRCNVSEPTLRRIMSGKVKTIPQITTLLDILTYILWPSGQSLNPLFGEIKQQ